MAMLTATDLQKSFILQDGRSFKALDGVTFSIEEGKLYTLLGPSGCGKTTTLRSIAGLEQPDSGRIAIAGTPVFDSAQRILVPPNRREIGMVFQSYAIWPHMNVFENVAFPLRVSRKRVPEREIAARVSRALATVQMEGFEKRPATRLSGGQQQRLALARALIKEPRLLLLDEPLSNLDAKLRESMRLELRRLQRELGITTVYVTHDQTEALALSDTVAVMSKGKIVQFGDPLSIYQRPTSRFVAEFIGSTNLIPGTVKVAAPAGQEAVVETGSGTLACLFPQGASAGAKVLVSIRPEDLRLSAKGAGMANGALNRIDGRVTERVFLGNVADYLIATPGAEMRVAAHPGAGLPPGSEVTLEAMPSACIVLADEP